MMYRKRRRRNETGSSSSNTGQMMNLALFIMLLAFFIVLNSLSSYEDLKTEKVKRSVELAFSSDPKQKEASPSVKPDIEQALRQGHTFDRIDALFEAEIASFESEKSKSRGVMRVKVPYEKFEQAVYKIGQQDLLQYPSREAVRGNFFLPTLISLVRTNIDGAPTRVEILFNTKNNPAELQNQSPSQIADIRDKLGAMAQHLEGKGMPQKLLNIGVSKGDPKYVDLVFRKYVAFSPTPTSTPIPTVVQ